MTPAKLLEVIALYRKFFENNHIPKISIDEAELWTTYPRHGQLGHCHGMLDQMEQFVAEGRLDKVNRWLGFIQGCLATLGVYTLEDLKNHNRS